MLGHQRPCAAIEVVGDRGALGIEAQAGGALLGGGDAVVCDETALGHGVKPNLACVHATLPPKQEAAVPLDLDRRRGYRAQAQTLPCSFTAARSAPSLS